jgi:thiol:disulfide interchange protein DsbD
LQPDAASDRQPPAEEFVPPPRVEQQGSASLPWILLMALLGGLILNLMPCVFPVLSLKVFAMAGQRERDDEAHLHSWIYAAGVVVSFVVVAGVMLLLRAGGEAVGWGFQLQEPLFISLLVYLFFILGLSFSGVVHIGGSLMGIGQSLVAGNPVKSSFFTGVLAVVVASPCSVPFMGVALGYAVAQSAPMALLVFAVLGFGMALPFVLLAYWPQMLHSLPAPGPWMQRLQQFLAFPLYATGVWLLWVLGQQGGQMAMVVVLGGLILLAMAGWLWRDASVRVWEKGLAVLVLLTALIVPHFLVIQACNAQSPTKMSTGDAEPYTAARLVELRAGGKPVLINMTAAWCLTCLVNEKVALSRESVQQRLHEKNITYLKGDWTNRDPEITRFLQQFGRNGVPLYLYFPAGRGSEVVVLPQVLTEKTVLDALN